MSELEREGERETFINYKMFITIFICVCYNHREIERDLNMEKDRYIHISGGHTTQWIQNILIINSWPH